MVNHPVLWFNHLGGGCQGGFEVYRVGSHHPDRTLGVVTTTLIVPFLQEKMIVARFEPGALNDGHAHALSTKLYLPVRNRSVRVKLTGGY